jgi:hypothetical protein
MCFHTVRQSKQPNQLAVPHRDSGRSGCSEKGLDSSKMDCA